MPITVTGGSAKVQTDSGIRGELFLQFAGFRRDRDEPAKLYKFRRAKWGFQLDDAGNVVKRGTTDIVSPAQAAALIEEGVIFNFMVVSPTQHAGQTVSFGATLKGIYIDQMSGEVEFTVKSERSLPALMDTAIHCGLKANKLLPESKLFDPDYINHYAEGLVEPVTVEQMVKVFLEDILLDAAKEGHLVKAETQKDSDWLKTYSFAALTPEEAEVILEEAGGLPEPVSAEAEEPDEPLPFESDLAADIRSAVGEGVTDLAAIEVFLGEKGYFFDPFHENGLLASLDDEALKALHDWVEAKRQPKL